LVVPGSVENSWSFRNWESVPQRVVGRRCLIEPAYDLPAGCTDGAQPRGVSSLVVFVGVGVQGAGFLLLRVYKVLGGGMFSKWVTRQAFSV
jgi:hypothetical protein